NLKDLILAHSDTKKKVDVFALIVYGLVVFPKPWGHVDEVKVDKVSCRVFSMNYSPLKEIVAISRGMILRRKNGWQCFRSFK
ncbi:hypothetical protein Golob_024049, partial [Gossypium lobatum]|nr:hypothetical protein [Gossypium lobatum]